MTHIYSAYRLHMTCIYVHVRKRSERWILDWFFIFGCKLVRRTRTKEIGLVVFVRSSSDGNGARLRFSSAKLRRKKSHCKKNHENHTVLVSPFSENWKWQVIAMIFCSGSLTHFVTGIVSHFCNSYMLQLCWNHKFRGFQKVSEGFKRWRWFQVSSFRFQK